MRVVVLSPVRVNPPWRPMRWEGVEATAVPVPRVGAGLVVMVVMLRRRVVSAPPPAMVVMVVMFTPNNQVAVSGVMVVLVVTLSLPMAG